MRFQYRQKTLSDFFLCPGLSGHNYLVHMLVGGTRYYNQGARKLARAPSSSNKKIKKILLLYMFLSKVISESFLVLVKHSRLSGGVFVVWLRKLPGLRLRIFLF